MGYGQSALLFKYAGYNPETKAPIYYRVEKRGYNNKGFVIRENSFKETIIGSNKTELKEGATKLMNSENIDTLLNLTNQKTGQPFFPDFVTTTVVSNTTIETYGEDLEGLTSEQMADKTKNNDPSSAETEQRKKEC